MTGYILTPTGDAALAAFDDDRVRYAASLDDGKGLVAFDGPEHGIALGAVLEPIPDYPPSWPKPEKAAPKRFVTNGSERFATVTSEIAATLMADAVARDHITGIVEVQDGLVLVETDGWHVPLAIWTAGVVEVRDNRLVTV